MKDEKIDINGILQEYSPDYSVFREEDDRIHLTKVAVYNELDETDRRIILVYAHLGNIRDTADVFRVSSTTIWCRINDIKKRIKEYLERYGYN